MTPVTEHADNLQGRAVTASLQRNIGSSLQKEVDHGVGPFTYGGLQSGAKFTPNGIHLCALLYQELGHGFIGALCRGLERSAICSFWAVRVDMGALHKKKLRNLFVTIVGCDL